MSVTKRILIAGSSYVAHQHQWMDEESLEFDCHVPMEGDSGLEAADLIQHWFSQDGDKRSRKAKRFYEAIQREKPWFPILSLGGNYILYLCHRPDDTVGRDLISIAKCLLSQYSVKCVIFTSVFRRAHLEGYPNVLLQKSFTRELF